ncbi:ENV2 protein, partial [Vidua macroura]|nr:ENV2 protein [Vidua macroura]
VRDSENPLWTLMKASYQALNTSNPNATKHCWLCYDIKPPFYEAIGVTDPATMDNESNPRQCLWSQKRQKQGITLQHVTGKGRCIG